MPSKMFHPTTPSRPFTSGTRGNPFLKRAGFFAGALLLLWLAFQLLPTDPAESDALYTDTGTVAAKPEMGPASQRPTSMVRPGYVVAVMLLAGGVAFAVYLRRRNGLSGQKATPIRTLGTSQIAPGQQLRLISCGTEVLLLGVTSTQINLLKSFPADAFEQSADSLEGGKANDGREIATAEHIGHSFASLLQQLGTQPAQQTQTEKHRWPA